MTGRSIAGSCALPFSAPGRPGFISAYLIKRRRPDADVAVIEQNPADATFGFGVVFSDRALEFLREGDAETFAAITPQMEAWDDMTLVHRNERVVIDGIGFAAIGRLKLLQLLQARVRSVGTEPDFSRTVTSLDEFGDADLVVGADGVNSLVRRSFADEFGASVSYLANHFAWFGTAQVYDTLTQTFRHTPIGDFNAHHYRYAPGRSTFIVEVDEATFARAGFENGGRGIARRLRESLCRRARRPSADFQQFDLAAVSAGAERALAPRQIRADRRRAAHRAFLHRLGHAAGDGGRHRARQGAGRARDDVAAALPAFEAARRPIVEKLVTGANASAAWYEHFAEHMALAPVDFAMSYITRSGRIDIERLRKLSPRFVARYERERS